MPRAISVACRCSAEREIQLRSPRPGQLFEKIRLKFGVIAAASRSTCALFQSVTKYCGGGKPGCDITFKMKAAANVDGRGALAILELKSVSGNNHETVGCSSLERLCPIMMGGRKHVLVFGSEPIVRVAGPGDPWFHIPEASPVYVTVHEQNVSTSWS